MKKFLQDFGATVVKTTPYGEYITAAAPVKVWNALFATTFYYFEHESKATRPVIRAVHYSLPQELASHVEGVFNTVQLPPRTAFKTAAVLKGKEDFWGF